MESSHEVKLEAKPSRCRMIYDYAKANDWKALDEFISKTKCSIDVTDASGRRTAALMLARENDFDRLKVLLHIYKANINRAVEGAALGNQQLLVKKLISLGADRSYAVHGAALAGHFQLLKQLIIKSEVKFHSLQNLAVYGAAEGGHLYKVLELIQEGASIEYAMTGAGRGNWTQIIQLLPKHYINDAAYGAGLDNHFKLIQELIAQGASMDSAVGGAASGGHSITMELLIGMGASKNKAIFGAARYNHRKLVEKLISQGANIDWAVSGAMTGWQAQYAETLLLRGASIHAAIEGARLACGYKNPSDTETLSFLSSFKRNKTRERFVVEAKRIINLDPNTKKTFLLKAKQIRRLKIKYKIAFNQALKYVNNPEVHKLMSSHHINLEQAIALSLDETQGLALFGETYLSLKLLAITATYLSPIKETDVKRVVQIAQNQTQEQILFEEKLSFATAFFQPDRDNLLFRQGSLVLEAISKYQKPRDYLFQNEILHWTMELIAHPNEKESLNKYNNLLQQFEKVIISFCHQAFMLLGTCTCIAALTTALSAAAFIATYLIGVGIFLTGVGLCIYANYQFRQSNKHLSAAACSFFQTVKNNQDRPVVAEEKRQLKLH